MKIAETEYVAEGTAALSVPGIREFQCKACHAWAPAWYMGHVGTMEAGYRDIRSRGWNEEIARARSLAFEHVRSEPSDMSDAASTWHRFHFLLRHLGVALPGIFEVEQGEPTGYRFEVVELRSECALRWRVSLFEREFGLAIVGTKGSWPIDRDRDPGTRMPILVIDGREADWEDLGRRLMTFEGCRFKLIIEDQRTRSGIDGGGVSDARAVVGAAGEGALDKGMPPP